MVGGNWLKSIFFLFLDHLPGFPNYTFLYFQKKFFSLHPTVHERVYLCNRTVCRTPAANTVLSLLYEQTHFWIRYPHHRIRKAYTLFTEINHCILTRWLRQPSEAIKNPRLNDLNRSALKGYKLAVTHSASTKTSRNTLTILQKACIQLVKVLIIKPPSYITFQTNTPVASYLIFCIFSWLRLGLCSSSDGHYSISSSFICPLFTVIILAQFLFTRSVYLFPGSSLRHNLFFASPF